MLKKRGKGDGTHEEQKIHRRVALGEGIIHLAFLLSGKINKAMGSCPQRANITITIFGEYSVDTAGLPTRASSKDKSCLLRIASNDWLSPTDLFLNAHGIGQCGARPHSLICARA